MLLCSATTFCPFCTLQQISSLFLLRTHSCLSSTVFPPGVSQLHLYATRFSRCHKKTSPVEPQDWHIQNFVYPSRIGRASAIKQNEFFRVKLVVISMIFISQLLMKMHWSCETWSHWRLEREQGKISLHTVALSYSRWCCFFQESQCYWATWAGGGRCSLEAPIFLLCLSLFWITQKSHVCHRNLEYFWCSQGSACFHLKRCLTGAPEEADNVFRGGYSRCPLPLFRPWWKAPW